MIVKFFCPSCGWLQVPVHTQLSDQMILEHKEDIQATALKLHNLTTLHEDHQ